MADTEVNAAPQFGLDGHLDDDLIDYDSDAERILDQPEYMEAAKNSEDAMMEKPGVEADRLEVSDEHDFDNEAGVFEGGEKNEANSQANVEHAADGHDDAHETTHEIDYDFDEPTPQHAETITNEDEQTDLVEQERSEETSHVEENQDQGEEQNEDEDHEISWERDDDPMNEGSLEQATASEIGEDASLAEPSTSDRGKQAVPDGQSDVAVGTGEAYGEDTEATGDGGEHDADFQDNGEQESHSQTEYSDVDEHGFPSITVNYKGDEFPFFSLSSEGFFSQLSVLDDNIKSLLVSLREELENELLAGDNLVLQVDELGLEFSEASSPDATGDITLRQILEVFDILVKNQDPESSRPLYIYLLTRPHTSTRLDYLMESAAAGKGLDEVIHLFQPPAPHTTAFTVSVDEEFDTQVDDHDSNGSDHAEQVAENVAEHQTSDEEGLGEITAENGLEGHDGEDDESINEPGEFFTHDSDIAQESEEVSQLFDEAVASGALAPDDDVGDGEDSDAQPLDEDLHQTEDKAFDLVDLDLDNEAEELDNDLVETAEQLGQDYLEGASTTTTTLKDDGETAFTPLEIVPVDTIIDEIAIGDPIGDDPLAEIDWRDETEPHLLDQVVEEELSGAIKRARGDDEIGADDNQNAKRQRS